MRNSINLSELRLNFSSNGEYLLVTLASRHPLALGQVAAVRIGALVSRATANISHNIVAGTSFVACIVIMTGRRSLPFYS